MRVAPYGFGSMARNGLKRLAVLAALAAATIALVPASAGAADRFASPSGTALDDCADPDVPCSIERAVNMAASGDDITLLPGSYSTSTPLGGLGAFNRTIHGAPGARPTINFTAAATGETGIFLRSGSVIRDVVLESTAGNGGSALFVQGATIERVSVHETGAHASGPSTRACGIDPGSVIRDSVCWYSGAGGNAAAMQMQSPSAGGTSEMRNVTAVATNAPAIHLIAFGSGSTLALTGTNVIAKGGGIAGEEDVKSVSTSGAVSATATFDHSNYASEGEGSPTDTITNPGSGTNQTAPLSSSTRPTAISARRRPPRERSTWGPRRGCCRWSETLRTTRASRARRRTSAPTSTPWLPWPRR